MQKKRILALMTVLCLAVGSMSGCSSRAKVTEDMIPTVTDLRADGPSQEEAEVLGLAMNTSYLSELTRLDGDNTEAAGVEAKDIQLVMKATSVDRDLKIKFVNEKNGRVVTGTEFSVKVTDPDKKVKEYSDEDKDGIIHIKKLTGGSYKVSMEAVDGFTGGKDITAKVKGKIEYAVVDVTDEIKKESEIDVSQEDNAYGSGGGNDDTTTQAPVLQDTVEFVESTKTPIYDTNKVQKTDEFGQLVYSEQKLDQYGTPMYAKILAEPTADHADANGDKICDRCGASLAAEEEEPAEGTEPSGDTGTSGNTESSGDTNSLSNTGTSGTVASQERTVPETTTQTPSTNTVDKIVYDTTSAPVYDTESEPVYEEAKIIGYKYTGWQTIDGKTYYYDKDGNRVTGTQVIQGIQYTFEDSGDRTGTIGIDVSKYQKAIDWKQVKNAGIDYVMVRCGYRGYGTGVLVEDPMFRAHVSGAKAAGLQVGLYFFSQAITEAEAVEEASMAVSLAQAVGGITLPIAIDSEYANGGAGRADKLSKADRTTITKAFCNTIANSGYTPMVYASKSWFGTHLNVSQFPSSYRIWVAHYADACGYTGRYDIWQYTDKGKVAGVSGSVDMNISYM